MNHYSRYIKIIKKISFYKIPKKVFMKLQEKIYYKFREAKVKKNPISIETYFLKNWSTDLKFLFDNKYKAYFVKKLKDFNQENDIIIKADRVYNHIFDLLGSGEKYLGQDIKWNQDFKTGFVWENDFYKKIKLIDSRNNADVKVPWELSRFQHIPVLGQAYWITENEKYAEEFKNQIEDWIKKNPVEMSVNWTMAMEVAIRACNWIVGIYYFRKSKNSDDFWPEINKWLYLHGDYIIKNLSKSDNKNNHYISDLVGLVWLGLYFRSLKYNRNKAEKWLQLGLKELEIEMEKQVFDDGCDYEAATYYHCLVTELLLFTLILCDYNGVFFSVKFSKKLEKMCEVIMNITKPNGLIPLIGDMDNGRFLIFSGYAGDEMRDFRHLLGVAGEYFDRDDFREHASNQTAALWFFKELKKPQDNGCELNSISFPLGGLHLLRNDRIYIFVRCGPNGTGGRGSHTHNDQLSFELNIEGEDFIVDPGVYVYTANYKMRNLFRSTANHNTVWINDLEQNDFDSEILFSLEDQTNAEVIKFEANCFVGRHYGYFDKAKVIIERSIEIHKDEIIIEDNLIDKRGTTNKINSKLPAQMNFILDSDVIPYELENIIYLVKKNMSLSIETGKERFIRNTFISNNYGQLIKTKKVVSIVDYGVNITRISIKSLNQDEIKALDERLKLERGLRISI